VANNDYQIVPVPIRPGMREDIHRHAAVDPGTLRYAQNVRWGDQGAAIRRYGTTEIATTGATGNQATIAGGYPVEIIAADYGGTLVGGDGTAFALRDDETGWRYAGRYSSAEPRPGRVDLYRNQASQITADQQVAMAIDSAGRRFFAYTADRSGADQRLYYTLQDADGSTIESRMYTNVRRVRACAVGADIYVCCQRYSSNQVDVYRHQAGGTLTLVTSGLVTLDAAADSWDMSAWTSTRWAFASLDSSSTTITIRRMSAGTTEASVTTTTNVLNTTRLTIYGDTDHVWLGYNNIGTTDIGYIRAYSWNGSVLGSAFAVATAYSWTVTTQQGSAPWIGPGPSATQVRFAGTIHNQGGHATPDVYSLQFGTINTSGTVANTGGQYYAIPASKPFGPSGQYLWADMLVRRTPADVFESSVVRCLLRCRQNANAASEPPYYVVDLVGYRQTEAAVETAPGFLDGSGYDRAWVPARTLQGTYFAAMMIDVVGGNATAGATGRSRFYSFREFAVSSTTLGVMPKRDNVNVDTSLVIAGQPCVIQRPVTVHDSSSGTTELNQDGFEIGIHRAPVILSTTASNGSGTLTSSSTYQYCACYRVADAYGRVQRSPPSSPTSVTMGASDDTVAVVISTIEAQRNLLSTIEGVVELYRTEAGGSTFYLVSDTLVNDVTALTVSATDTIPDSTLTSREVLYTQASHVANDMAPACRFLRASEARLWAAGGWDATIVQASQILVPGEVPNWSDLDQFKIRLPKPCVGGLAFQDGALLAFGATDIYAIGTDGGPGNDGLGTFADPRLISPGIGCEEPASIVETPVGVFFRSRRGFELMPRGLGTPQPLPGVETTLETYSVVASACLHVDETAMTVQVVMRNPSNAATRTLVYDLDRSAWSVDVYPVDVAQIGITADGRLLMASDDTSTSPAFLVESSSAKDDDAVFFQSRLTFHDLYPFGVFKEGQVNSVLARAGADGTCVLNVDIGVNGATARNVTWTIGAATTFETYREQTPAATQPRGTSIQLDVYDTTSGDAAGGASYFGFGLHVSDKDSVVGLAAAERA
jgi:hypothetical protein